jgi:hypothetical protein
MSREQKLEAWRGQGMSEAEAEFLRGSPELIDNPQLTAYAAAQAAEQGHQRGTTEHMTATGDIPPAPGEPAGPTGAGRTARTGLDT